MTDHCALYTLYKAMMTGQQKGLCTEHNLLDCARFWWYNGYEGFNTDH
jgi:hypothetical protein